MPAKHENHTDPRNGSANKFISEATDDIRKDLGTLQSDVAAIASDVKKAGTDKARMAIDYVNDQVGTLKDTGTNALGKLEEGIKSNPGQSVTIAFVAGVLISFLFNRRY